MTQGRWTTLVVLLLAALLLAGCGGGGDDGVKQDLEAQLEALMAERDAAKATQQTAEAARAAAEEARATADAARKAADEARATAETERDAAKAAQLEAEAAEAEALAAQAEAVAAQTGAEAAQTAAEAARDAAVKAKTAAETARDEARDAKTQAEIDLIAAQSAQALAERRRDAANTAKTTAETARAAALAARQTAETQRDEALAAQTTAENALAEANASKTTTEGELVTVRQQLVTANASLQTTQDALEDANDDLKDAQDDLDDLKDAQDDLQTANDELARVKKERDDAVRDLARAEGTLEGLRSQLTEAQQDAVDAEQRTLQAEAEANRRIEEAEQQADVSERVGPLITALGKLADRNTTAPGASVEHKPGGNRTFKRPLSLPRSGTAPSVPGRWSSVSFIGRRGTTGTDTVYLYTNIEAPSSREFWKKYGESVLEITEGSPTGVPKVTVSGFGTQEKELYPDSNGTERTSGENKERSIGGTYDGYSGTFSCPSECDIKANAQGNLTFSAASDESWTFTSTAKTRNVKEEDTEHLYFGIWAYEPTEPTSETSDMSRNYDIQWIAGGDASGDAIGISDTEFRGLEGEAEFNGGAIGKYALKKVGRRAAKIGTFTATATFTADFDATPTLSGRITDFKEGGSSLGEDWEIFLGADASTAATLSNVGVGTTTSGASGEIASESVMGAWAATLHGSDNYDEFTPGQRNRDKNPYPKTKYPTADLAGVAGWFEASGTNAAIAGAFGAACERGAACGK